MKYYAIRYYRPILYFFTASMILLNLFAFIGGSYRAALPLLLQALVLFAACLNKSWAVFAISIWSLIIIMIGVFMWLAVILDGPSHFGSMMDGVLNSFVSLSGLYFFRYVKVGLGLGEKDNAAEASNS